MLRLPSLLLALLLVTSWPAETRSQTNWIEEGNAGVARGGASNSKNQTIRCFQCNSAKDPSCASIQVNHTDSVYYKPCSDTADYRGHQPFCRKIVQTIFERDYMTRVVRKCGWERHPKLDCYSMTNDDHVETVCQCFSDACNSAPRQSVGPALGLAVSTLAFLLVS